VDQQLKIPKRILSGLLSSLSAGVVPRVGAPYIAMGRSEEINALADDLEEIAEGGSKTRLIIGKYGSGKSFLLQLLRGYALERGFVCADCDLSPERRICGRAGTGLATYKELMKNIATRTSPDGNGLAGIISKWLDSLASSLAAEGFLPDTPAFEAELTKRVYAVAGAMEGQVGGFDFARVLLLYHRAGHDLDDHKKSCCLRWLRGEYTTKTEARRDLGVGSIIDDDSWFDFIKLFAVFVRQIGYKGLLIFIDECVNLYKIANRLSREANYEKLLSMYNDTLQGRAPGLGLFFGGTPTFLEDQRRGLYSYEALKSRLSDGRIAAQGGYRNLMGPIIRLKRMSDSELLALCHRITDLHGRYHGKASGITDEQIIHFLTLCLDRAGANELITPREIIREYITVLDVMLQNPNADYYKIVGASIPALEKSENSDLSQGDGADFAEFTI
jgi:hypothetical protein